MLCWFNPIQVYWLDIPFCEAIGLKGEEVERTQITDMEDTEVMNQLFGVEVEESCETGDDECLKRRMISEAHLDYIYTQHHKP
ncbi:hypothetical protein GQ457_16G008390 [Hibiscus cannabinus]